jgi:hypothetical protein
MTGPLKSFSRKPPVVNNAMYGVDPYKCVATASACSVKDIAVKQNFVVPCSHRNSAYHAVMHIIVTCRHPESTNRGECSVNRCSI